MNVQSGSVRVFAGLIGALMLTSACGGTSPINRDDAGGGGGGGDEDMAMAPLPDLTQFPDLTPLKDLVGLIPEPCGNATCGVGQKCCFTGKTGSCMDSCPDGAFAFACYGPQDCAGNPCCVAIKNGNPSGLMCTKAKTDCVPKLDILSQSGQTRFCNVDADCTSGAPNTALNKCCSGMFMGQPGKICFDPQYAGFAKLTCN